MNLGHVGGNESEITWRKEGEGNQGKHRATRAGRPVEKPVSRRERKSGDEIPEADAAMKGRSIMSRKMTKEEHEVPESSAGEPGLGPGDTGPCGVNRGLPHVLNPCCPT